jgi:1,2-dihydroxy-3-keto-5-methylthiopentene dioxygenase
MGAVPRFCAIRFFQEEDGWVGNFTGDPISRRMPDLDQLLAPAQ